MTFNDFVGHEEAKLALILNAIDSHCGGVLFAGVKGSGKSTLARRFKHLLPKGTPFVNLPLNATEDALLGGFDMENTLKAGKKVFQPGILERAQGGFVYIDDVNLLAPEIMTLLFKDNNRTGHNAIAGVSQPWRLSPFILLGSMNPEEGFLSAHFLDRFGMCVLWETLKDPQQKIAVMKQSMPIANQETNNHVKNKILNNNVGWIKRSASTNTAEPPNVISPNQTNPITGIFHPRPKTITPHAGNPDHTLQKQIHHARTILLSVVVPSAIRDYLTQLAIDNCISGHRGDIFLFYAARAYAAFCYDQEVTKEHVDVVLPLVLIHRRRILQEREENKTPQPQHRNTPPEQKEPPERDASSAQDATGNHENRTGDNGSDGQNDLDNPQRPSKEAEETFDVGQAFKIRRLSFRKDRMNRDASGRRTKTGSSGKRGRHVKSILKNNGDIAIDATIRAAAPLQQSRGRKGMLLIRNEDLRFKQREKKMGHLVILAVDGSGSMGAQRRMVETKGAVQSLLADCYQKRDQVAMIVFRKDRAEIILPPTSSVERASRKLRDIPVGGKTPLTAGLLETFKLIKRVQMKSLKMRFLVVLVTDGRANQSLTDAPVNEEVQKMASLLGALRSTDYVVIDTENKKNFIKTDHARNIAVMLEADYYGIDDLKANHLTAIVRSRKAVDD
jgi:magnesium chelatase subunit D